MLELQNISVSVPTENGVKEILKDISMTLNDDTFTAITGPNGGGKSTLAKVIMGIQPPTSGKIIYQGEDITNLSITERAHRGISFAFQQPVRFKGFTVRDLLSIAADEELSTEKLCDYLNKVGLCALDYLNRPVDDSLSGGEMKRIEIAMLLARKTQLSIFDEPEAGIDLWSFQNLISVFSEMRKEFGGNILIISHQERILDIADEIVVLADGEITAQGARKKILPHLLHGEDICEFCPLPKRNVPRKEVLA